MIWQVLKPHYWMLDRQFRGNNRYGIILTITLLLMAVQWLYNNLIQDQLHNLESDSVFVNILLLGLIGTVLFTLLDANNMLYQLFESPEIDILTVNPVPQRTVYTVKLLQASRASIIPGILLAAVLVFTGRERDLPLTFYPFTFIALAGILITITATVMSLLLIICRFIPPRRLRSGILIAFTVMPLFIILFQSQFSIWFSMQTELHNTIADLILEPVPLSVVVIGTTGFVVMWSFKVFTNTFLEGFSRYQTIQSKATNHKSAMPSPRWLAKEWHIFRRDTRLFLSFFQPMILVFMFILPWLNGSSISEGMKQIIFWYMLVATSQLLLLAPLTAGELLVWEGRNIGLIRTSPVTASDMMRVKFWMIYLPQTCIWLLCVLFMTMIFHFQLWQVMVIWGTVVIGMALNTLMALGIAANWADFNAERIPRLIHLLLLGINALWASAWIILAAWAIWHIFPDDDVNTVITALNINFSSHMWLLVFAVHGIMFLLLRVIWQRGQSRLNHWEINDMV